MKLIGAFTSAVLAAGSAEAAAAGTCDRLRVTFGDGSTNGHLINEYTRQNAVMHCGRSVWERKWPGSQHNTFGNSSQLFLQCQTKPNMWLIAEHIQKGARVWAIAPASDVLWPRNTSWRLTANVDPPSQLWPHAPGREPPRPLLRVECLAQRAPTPKMRPSALEAYEPPKNPAEAMENCPRLHHGMTIMIPVRHPNSFEEITYVAGHGDQVEETAASFCRRYAPASDSWQHDCTKQLQLEVSMRHDAIDETWSEAAAGRGGFHRSWTMSSLVDVLMPHVGSFIESGTFLGFTLAYMAQRYPAINLFSCEPDDAHHAVAACNVAPWTQKSGARWQPHRSVNLFHETSQSFIRRLENAYAGRVILDPALIFLDAHGYGFAWPLREEVYYYTRKFRGGFVLIDDFRVPLATKSGRAKQAVVGEEEEEFGFDAYDGQECSFEYIAGQMPPQEEVPWQLYYPVSAQPVIGNTEFNRSLNDVYTSRTNAEPKVSSCTEAGRCTGAGLEDGGEPAVKPRGWGLIAFGTHAHLDIDKWLPHIVRRDDNLGRQPP